MRSAWVDEMDPSLGCTTEDPNRIYTGGT